MSQRKRSRLDMENAYDDEEPAAIPKAWSKLKPHTLFSGPAIIIRVLFDKIYRSKLALRKLRIECGAFNDVSNIEKCKKLNWFAPCRPIQMSHPLISEMVKANTDLITLACNQLAAQVYMNAYETQIQTYLADIKAIISATFDNYDRFVAENKQQYQHDELNTWLPTSFAAKISDVFNEEKTQSSAVQADADEQRELFARTLQNYKLNLERRYAQLKIADHLCPTLSAKWLDHGKKATLAALRIKSKTKMDWWTSRYKDNEQVKIVQERQRKLYLKFNPSIVALAPSMAIIRCRRNLVLSQMVERDATTISNLSSISAELLKDIILTLTKNKDMDGLNKLFDIEQVKGTKFQTIINQDDSLMTIFRGHGDFQLVDNKSAERPRPVPQADFAMNQQGAGDQGGLAANHAPQRQAYADERQRGGGRIDVNQAGVCHGNPNNPNDDRHSLASHFRWHKL